MSWESAAARENREIRARAGVAITQLLFSRGDGLSLERIGKLLRAGFRNSVDPLERAVASLSTEERVTAIIETNRSLQRVGLRLQLMNGFCRLETLPVRPEAFAAVFANHTVDYADMVSPAGLEVLAAVAFRQPIDYAQLEAWFDGDKRGQLDRLLSLGLIEKFRQPGGKLVFGTTLEFMRHFKVKDRQELAAIWAKTDPSHVPPEEKSE
ncbi:MAG: SMC-Scp complex subunit ScpB [Verrucomicrobia bacterium]|nr:SMC-Scp complex subunit ScpB [Verrucomicrobiota bacterium]